jgi:hypothetical protein
VTGMERRVGSGRAGSFCAGAYVDTRAKVASTTPGSTLDLTLTLTDWGVELTLIH